MKRWFSAVLAALLAQGVCAGDCSESTAVNWPGLCRDIAEASLDGWRYARDNPEETLDIVMEDVRRGHFPDNRAHMKWMLEKIIVSIFSGQGDAWQFGVLSETQYNRAAALLRERKLIRAAPAFGEFHPFAPACGATAGGGGVPGGPELREKGAGDAH
ncbi:MAG: hypothetical protein PHP98_11485 [Kiritimatiellae bacterium]|nr:hypothetical protein [Kiritimatiellia bacterium]